MWRQTHAGARARNGACWTCPVSRSACRRGDGFAGRSCGRPFWSAKHTIAGLLGIAAGSFILSVMPATFGLVGYVAPIVVLAASYALFQAANSTVFMTGIRPDQRGIISAMLSLSRNLGLITGASAMGAVFAIASMTADITKARPEAVATGMRITFAVAAILIVVAIAAESRALATRPAFPSDVS